MDSELFEQPDQRIEFGILFERTLPEGVNGLGTRLADGETRLECRRTLGYRMLTRNPQLPDRIERLLHRMAYLYDDGYGHYGDYRRYDDDYRYRGGKPYRGDDYYLRDNHQRGDDYGHRYHGKKSEARPIKPPRTKTPDY